jgi:hypothetical protein
MVLRGVWDRTISSLVVRRLFMASFRLAESDAHAASSAEALLLGQL